MCDDDCIDLRCFLRHCPPAPRYRHKILYASTNCALLQSLRDELKGCDCYLDYCPAGHSAHILLKSEIAYALLLFDEVQEESAAQLAQYARTLAHRARTPSLILKPEDSPKQLAATIRRLLATAERAQQHTFAP